MHRAADEMRGGFVPREQQQEDHRHHLVARILQLHGDLLVFLRQVFGHEGHGLGSGFDDLVFLADAFLQNKKKKI